MKESKNPTPEPTTQAEALAEITGLVAYALHDSLRCNCDSGDAHYEQAVEMLAAHDATVAAEAKAAGLREAADEVQIERRWQTELTMRGVPEIDITYRLGVIERVFRDRAARIEATR